jgi:hypothetical protein
MSNLLENFKDKFVLFLEAGFIAVNHADEDSAQKLFAVSKLLKPESTLNQVGLGYLHLCKLELKMAEGYFKKVLEIDPVNDMARTFLGVTLSLSPKEGLEGEKILTEIAKSGNEDSKKLSKDALDFVDTFVKKKQKT